MTGVIGYSSNRDGNIDDNDAISLQHELSEQEKEEKRGRLTPIDNNYKLHVADLTGTDRELLERERALVKILTPDLISNDKERNNKISYYVHSKLPISELEWAYGQIRTITRKASKMNQYTARINYANNNNTAPEAVHF